jgi:hypothetical protein
MEIRTEILKENSKTQAEKIACWIGDDPGRMRQLMQLFLNDEYRVVQRAAWIMSIVAGKHLELVTPYLPEMVVSLHATGKPVAVKRNVVRILQHLEIPEELHGDVMNRCFDFLADPKETVAVRCFSMTILGNLAKYYPEIKTELRAIIEDQLEQGCTAGFRARAKMVLGGL